MLSSAGGQHRLKNVGTMLSKMYKCWCPVRSTPGPRLSVEVVTPCMRISVVEMGRSRDRLIFVVGIPMPEISRLYTETAPSVDLFTDSCQNSINCCFVSEYGMLYTLIFPVDSQCSCGWFAHGSRCQPVGERARCVTVCRLIAQ